MLLVLAAGLSPCRWAPSVLPSHRGTCSVPSQKATVHDKGIGPLEGAATDIAHMVELVGVGLHVALQVGLVAQLLATHTAGHCSANAHDARGEQAPPGAMLAVQAAPVVRAQEGPGLLGQEAACHLGQLRQGCEPP